MASKKRRPARPAEDGKTSGRRSDDVSRSGKAPDRGTLIMIGGAEDKEGEKLILLQLHAAVGDGPLVISTAASRHPQETWKTYQQLFRSFGVKDVRHLHVESRKDAFAETRIEILAKASAVFFTGGDQVRITSKLSGTPLYERIREIFLEGGVVAGTSAGASAMSETMLVGGGNDQSPRVADTMKMAPGLGFLAGVIIDQHFGERGRLGRLVGAVTQNPRVLGIGIDEDTAIIVKGREFRVMGSGSVYVVDGIGESFTNLSEEEPDENMSAFDLRLHILSHDDKFDLEARRPERGPRRRLGWEQPAEPRPAPAAR